MLWGGMVGHRSVPKGDGCILILPSRSQVTTGVCCKTSCLNLVDSWSKQEGGCFAPFPTPLPPQDPGNGAGGTPQDTPGWGKTVRNFSQTFPAKNIMFQQNCDTPHLGIFFHLASREIGKKQSGWVLEVLVGELNWSSRTWLCQSKQDNTPKEK